MCSLSKDRNDARACVNIDSEIHRNTGIGFVTPFFFTRETATLPLVGGFPGASAFLIGRVVPVYGTWI